MIIDFHAHIYPDKISEKATKAIGDFYNAGMAYNGSVAELLKSGEQIGVDKYVVHSVATKAEQVESINNFIITQTNMQPKFIGFGTIHPCYANFESEIKRVHEAGLKGIKIHPDFQKFPVDEAEMDNIYEVIAGLGIPVLIHAGDIRYDFTGPKRIANVLDKHPTLKVVAAHFGGYTQWDESFEYLAGRKVWFDTSSTSWKLPLADALKILAKHGTDKFLFGSDFPMWDHLDEFKRFQKLGLKDDDLDAILYKNALDLLNIKL